MGSSGVMAWAGSCSSSGLFCSDTNFEVVKAGVMALVWMAESLLMQEGDKKFIRPSWATS